MTSEQKKTWLTALRSGMYSQTQQVLHRKVKTGNHPVGYCCLGVYAVCRGFNLISSKDGNYADHIRRIDGRDVGYDIFNEEIPNWTYLANMNDSGMSFLEIADYIEQKIKPTDNDTI